MWTLPQRAIETADLSCRVIAPTKSEKFTADFKRALDLRMRVFVHEQNVPADQEADWIDEHPDCAHFLFDLRDKSQDADEIENSLVGTLRLFPFQLHPDEDLLADSSKQQTLLKLGRFAVDGKWRGRGFGRQMIQVVNEFLRLQQPIFSDNGVRLWIHAQLDKRGFYERCGFQPDPRKPEPFMEDGIVHCRMFRDCL